MKKYLILATIILTLFIVAACGGGDDTPAQTTNNNQQTGTNEQIDTPPRQDDGTITETTEQPPDDFVTTTGAGSIPGDFQWADGLFPGVGIHPPKDMGGRTLTFGAWWDTPIGAYLWEEEPPDRDSLNYDVAMAMWANARRVEEVFNVKFARESVVNEEFMTTLTASVIARSPFADVVVLTGNMQLDAIGSIIQPWNANLPNSDILGENRFAAPVMTDTEGNVWTIHHHTINTDTYVMAVNLDIIAAEGLPNPVELYEAGNWNWDTMLEIMRGASKDTDSDGVNDQFGIAGVPAEIAMHLLGANDGMMVDADFNYALRHPNSVAALEFLEQIMHERLWAAEAGGVMDTDNWDRNFYAGNREGNAALFPTTVWGIDNFPPAFNFAIVPFPQGPNNTSGNTWLAGMRQGYCIPVGTSWDVEDIVIILDELYSWPGNHPEMLFEAGDIDWLRETFLTEADVQRAVRASASANSDMGRNVPQYYWVLNNLASYFWNREFDVTQAIETERAVHQDMLDRRFRQ